MLGTVCDQSGVVTVFMYEVLRMRFLTVCVMIASGFVIGFLVWVFGRR
jgi:hypothetical protein